MWLFRESFLVKEVGVLFGDREGDFDGRGIFWKV